MDRSIRGIHFYLSIHIIDRTIPVYLYTIGCCKDGTYSVLPYSVLLHPTVARSSAKYGSTVPHPPYSTVLTVLNLVPMWLADGRKRDAVPLDPGRVGGSLPFCLLPVPAATLDLMRIGPMAIISQSWIVLTGQARLRQNSFGK